MSSSSSISIITQELLLATALVGGISFLAGLFYFLFYLVEVLGIACQGKIQGYCFCDSSGLQPGDRDPGNLSPRHRTEVIFNINQLIIHNIQFLPNEGGHLCICSIFIQNPSFEFENIKYKTKTFFISIFYNWFHSRVKLTSCWPAIPFPLRTSIT